MTSNAAGVLILLAIFGTVSSNPDGGVDCRKFVFAPLCRGVAAKRDHPNSGHYDPAVFTNEDSDKYLLGSLRAAIDTLEQDAEDSQTRTWTNKQNKAENLINMYQQEQTNRLLRFLFGNRRGNSEKDSFLGQDFENL